MSEFVNILTEERQGILYLTINREDKLNAMNLATLAELRSVFDQVMDNKAIKAVILTGDGE
jgi:enoyl-CoA hydratase